MSRPRHLLLALLIAMPLTLPACNGGPDPARQSSPEPSPSPEGEPATEAIADAVLGRWENSFRKALFEYTVRLEFREGGEAFFRTAGFGVPRPLRDGLTGSWTLEGSTIVTDFYRPDTDEREVKRWAVVDTAPNTLTLRPEEEDTPGEWHRTND
ncbi:MAG: hypothetical protein JJU33_14100 [Phycisphaerales bacterium]|nr:hypothetical protein [Phycisphaerales bacterium]